MATNIVLKRSATADAAPTTSDLELGELALNTYDGKIYMKKTVNGTSSIVNLSGTVAPTSSAFSHTTYKFTASGSTTTFTGSDDDSKTLSYTAGQIQVFLNGILLDASDYTASNGSSVVLGSATGSGSILYVISFEGTNPFDYFKYTATSGQTSFSGNDANSESLLYTVGNIAVYLNGVLLDATDYTATSGTSVVLASGATSGDILTIWEFNETGLSDLSTDTSPQLGGDLDVVTHDIVSTSNRHIDIVPHGTGNVTLQTDTVQLGSSAENVTVTTNSTGDLTLNTNSGTNSGSIVIADGANNNITLTPNGSGNVVLDNHTWPNADGSANQVLQTNGSGVLSFTSISSSAITDTDGNTKIQVEEGSNDDTIRFDVGGTEQIVLVDGVLRPTTDNDIDLGTSSIEFKDAYFDGTVTSDAFAGPLTGDVTGDLTGTADLATSVTVSANNSTDETVYPVFVDGATGTQGAETDTGLTYNPSSGTLTSSIFVGALTGAVTGNADTATTATNVTASANNSTDETVYPTFVDGATGGQGIETDTGLTYNPSSGIITATQFTGNVVGNVTGNVTGNTSGTAATVTGAAQSAITSVGTLTTLTVDNVIINGTTIGHTGDTDLMTLTSGNLTVAGDVYIGDSNKELRFYEGSNYVGFEAPALSANQIWVLPNADGTANQTLKTDGSGNLSWATAASAVSNLTDVTLSSLASNDYLRYNGSAWVNTSQASNPVVDTMTGDNSDTTLTLTHTPLHENATLVTIDGVVQHKSTYSVSGNTLTFSTAPPTGSAVECITNVNTNILNGNDVTVDTMTGDNSDTTLSLSVTPTNENHVNVYWDGVYQHKDNWSLSGTTITFDTAPGTGVKVEAVSNQMMSAGTATDLTATAISGKTLVTAVGADHLLVYDATDGALKKALVSDVIEQSTTEEIQDIVGGMVSSNTETGIAVTYEDGDGTLDFVLAAAQPTVTSLGTLTALTVDNLSLNGTTIGHTSDTDLLTLADGALSVAGTLGVGTSSIHTGAKAVFVDGAGTLPTMAAGDVLTIQNNDGTSDNAGFTAIAGTAGLSYINFGDSGDKNIGGIIYDHTNNSLDFYANAGERMSIDSAGNVGIGTASGAGGTLTIEDNSKTVLIAPNSSDTIYYDQANLGIRANTLINLMPGGNTRLSVANGGTTVTGTLDVSGAATVSSINASGGFLNGSNGGIRIHTSGTKFFNVTANNAAQDATMDIGAADARFKDLHLSGVAYIDGGAVFNEDSADVDFRVESNNQTHMLFVDAGNDRIGIGTNTPGHMLNLVSSGDAGIHIFADSDNSGEGDNPYLSMSQDGSTAQQFKMGLIGNAGDEFTNSIANASYIHANNDASQPLMLAHDGALVMTLKSGNVGIGNTSPDYPLSINTTGNTIMQIRAGSSSWSSIYFGDQDAAYRGVVQYNHSDNHMDFYTNGSERMRITSGGSVGIGVTPESNWASDVDVLQVGGLGAFFCKSSQAASSGVALTYNVYDHTSTGQAYIVTDEASQYKQDDGNHHFYTAASGSADAAISWSEKVRIQNGGGISFNGDTAAANALDDYEEGTFTPTYTVGGGGSVTGVTGTNAGTYTKVGRMCTVSVTSNYVATSGTVPTYYLLALPFTAADTASGLAGGGFGQETGQTGAGMLIKVEDNSTNAIIWRYNGAAVPANSYFSLSFTYQTT